MDKAFLHSSHDFLSSSLNTALSIRPPAAAVDVVEFNAHFFDSDTELQDLLMKLSGIYFDKFTFVT